MTTIESKNLTTEQKLIFKMKGGTKLTKDIEPFKVNVYSGYTYENQNNEESEILNIITDTGCVYYTHSKPFIAKFKELAEEIENSPELWDKIWLKVESAKSTKYNVNFIYPSIIIDNNSAQG